MLKKFLRTLLIVSELVLLTGAESIFTIQNIHAMQQQDDPLYDTMNRHQMYTERMQQREQDRMRYRQMPAITSRQRDEMRSTGWAWLIGAGLAAITGGGILAINGTLTTGLVDTGAVAGFGLLGIAAVCYEMSTRTMVEANARQVQD